MLAQKTSQAWARWVMEGIILLLLFIVVAVPTYFVVQSWAGAGPREVVQLGGAGSTFGELTYWGWGEMYSKDHGDVVTYLTSPNTTRLAAILMNDTKYVYAGFDTPMETTKLDELNLIQFPSVATGVVVFCKIPSQFAPAGPINMTIDVILGLFNQTILNWNDPRILALNPNINEYGTLYGTVHPVYYTTESGATLLLSEALGRASPDFRIRYGTGELINWPLNNVTSVGVPHPFDMPDKVAHTDWSIGYALYPVLEGWRLKNNQDFTMVQLNFITVDTSTGEEPSVFNTSDASIILQYPSESLIKDTATKRSHIDNSSLAVTIDQPFNCSDCWPMTGFTYLLVYQDYKHVSDCPDVVEGVRDYFTWIYTNNASARVATITSYAFPSPSFWSLIEPRLQSLACNGKTVGSLLTQWLPALAVVVVLIVFVLIAVVRIAGGYFYTVYQRKKYSDPDEQKPLLDAASEAKVYVKESLLTSTILGGDLTLEQQIGTGSFGEVYRGKWRGATVAVKRFLVSSANAGQRTVLEDFINEANLMSTLRHPNIVQFLGAAIEGDHLYIVTELAERGSLYDVIKSDRGARLSFERKLDFCVQAARGMLYLHQYRPPIIHRDLKTANLLVDKHWNVKVTDFGLSRVVDTANTMTHCGTVDFCAPEVLRRNRYSTKADVYSFALVCWQIITRNDPFYGLALYEMMNKVINQNYRPPLGDVVAKSPALASLLNTCWDPDPEARPEFSEILSSLERITRELKGGHTEETHCGPEDGIIRDVWTSPARPEEEKDHCLSRSKSETSVQVRLCERSDSEEGKSITSNGSSSLSALSPPPPDAATASPGMLDIEADGTDQESNNVVITPHSDHNSVNYSNV